MLTDVSGDYSLVFSPFNEKKTEPQRDGVICNSLICNVGIGFCSTVEKL